MPSLRARAHRVGHLLGQDFLHGDLAREELVTAGGSLPTVVELFRPADLPFDRQLAIVCADGAAPVTEVARAACGEQVIVDLFVTAGRARVRVPPHWIVNTGALPLMGSIAIEDDRARTPAKTPPRLILRGLVLIGKVEVTS